MKFTVSGKCLKAVTIAATFGLWLIAWLIVWNLSWSWIDSQVPSTGDIKPFIIILLLGYYLIRFFPSVKDLWFLNKIENLSEIPKAKEKVS